MQKVAKRPYAGAQSARGASRVDAPIRFVASWADLGPTAGPRAQRPATDWLPAMGGYIEPGRTAAQEAR